MEAIPRNDGEQYRFDAFCKAVLRNEARNYHRNKKRLLDREKSFSVLSLEELGQLTSVCLLYTSPSPRDRTRSRMPSSA